MEVKTFNNLSVDEQFDLLNKYYNQGIGAEKLVSEATLDLKYACGSITDTSIRYANRNVSSRRNF